MVGCQCCHEVRKDSKRWQSSYDELAWLCSQGTTAYIKHQAYVDELICASHRVRQKYIAVILGISKERVHYSIHEMLGCRKVCVRKVPRTRIPEMKHHRRQQVCQEHFTAPAAQPRSGTLWLLFFQTDETTQGTPLRLWQRGASGCAYILAEVNLRFLPQLRLRVKD